MPEVDVRQRARPNKIATSMSMSILLLAVSGTAVTIVLWLLADATWRASLSTPGCILLTGSTVTLAMTVVALLQRQCGGSTRDQLAAIVHRATHDELTGLPNRKELHQRLDAALVDGYRHDRVVGVLFLDLDGFKDINDRMGHSAGDDLLRAFGQRLRAIVRANDVVARFGGDEFVVLCQGAVRESAIEEVAENILRAFEQPMVVGRRQLAIRTSIGVAVASRQNPATPIELISHADQAMYRAKRERSGVQVFDDAQRREVLDKREVERALLPALAEGQFLVHYQPIISVSRARVVGHEALLRWQHPIHGIIGTERFLPVAEEAGLLGRLSDVVLRDTTGQLSMWNELFASASVDMAGLSIGVNVVEQQLIDPNFPDRLVDVLAWAGVPAAQLALEISEDLLLRRTDEAAPVLRRLTELGFALVVDDFGTSRASLARTRSLDLVDRLKVDRSVVGAMTHDDGARAVVEASVSMARALDLQIIAVGVETLEQRAMLEDLGIDRMQGFLFCRPLSAEDLEERAMIAGSASEGVGIQ